MSEAPLLVRWKGLCDYLVTWEAMKAFTNQRTLDTPDEVWLLEHPPVFTQGQNGKPEHLLNANSIPVIPIDRGGQITYHGPGQLVAYVLVDLRRNKFNVRQLVSALEQSIVDLLQADAIPSNAKCDAPGVYVHGKKICSIGLRIRKGCSYHGLALNVDMDLSPFKGINPCGFDTLEMTQLSDYINHPTVLETGLKLIHPLSRNLGYTKHIVIDETHKSDL